MAASRPPTECVEGYLFVPAPFALLLLRRPPDRGRIWVPMSGRVEPGDRGLEATVRRELLEETGLEPDGPLLDLDWVVPFEGPDGGPWRLHAFGVPLAGRYTPALSPEHDGYAWLDARTAIARLHYSDNRAALGRLLERVGAGRAG